MKINEEQRLYLAKLSDLVKLYYEDNNIPDGLDGHVMNKYYLKDTDSQFYELQNLKRKLKFWLEYGEYSRHDRQYLNELAPLYESMFKEFNRKYKN